MRSGSKQTPRERCGARRAPRDVREDRGIVREHVENAGVLGFAEHPVFIVARFYPRFGNAYPQSRLEVAPEQA